MAEIPIFTDLDHLVRWANARGRKADLAPTVEFLIFQIKKEQAILQANLERTEDGQKMTLSARITESYNDASAHFVEEVNEFLAEGTRPLPLTPQDVMLFRRRAAAWAIASQIYEVVNGAAS